MAPRAQPDPWEAPDATVDRITEAVYYAPASSYADMDEEQQFTIRQHPEDAFYPHLLADDVAQSTFPMGGQNRSGGDMIRLEPDDERLERLISHALVPTAHFAQRGYRDLARMFAQWGNLCAAEMVRHGRALFELAYITRPADEHPVGFVLLPLDHRQVVSRGRHVYQRIQRGAIRPAESLMEEDRPAPVREIQLPRARLVVVRLAKEYLPIVSAIPILARLGTGNLPPFAIPDYREDEKSRVPFEFNDFQRTELVALAALTRATGWSARSSFDDYQSGYYAAWRLVKYERFKARLREALVAEFNSVLSRVGPGLGFRATVSLSGLLGTKEYETAERELARGTVSPTNLVRRLLRH